jgi:hypothetical protein
MPYFSLENPAVRRAAEIHLRGFLALARDGDILDEGRWLAALPSYLQVMVYECRKHVRFILWGGHRQRLREAIGQLLGGRRLFRPGGRSLFMRAVLTALGGPF